MARAVQPRRGRAVPGRHTKTLAAKYCSGAGVAEMPACPWGWLAMRCAEDERCSAHAASPQPADRIVPGRCTACDTRFPGSSAPASTRTRRASFPPSSIRSRTAIMFTSTARLSGARFNVISSGRSPFYKFVVQQIKKAGPRTDSAAKVEPTCPSRGPSRRPYPLSAPG